MLAAIVLVGLLLRWLTLDSQSFTSDEVTDLAVATDPASFGQLLDGAKRFPPLYHLVLRPVMALSSSDLAARWLSVVIGLATIAAIWRLGRGVAGPRAGLMAAGLAAIAPFQIWYSQETRPYGLFMLMAALTLVAFARLRSHPSVLNWSLYVAASVGGLFTHYYFALVVGFTLALLFLDGTMRRSIRRALASLLVLAVVAVPWVWALLSDIDGQFGDSAESEFGLAGLAYTFFSMISGYTLGPSQRELHVLDLGQTLDQYLPWLLLIGVPVLAISVASYRALRGSSWTMNLLSLAIGPVALIGVMSAVGPFGFNVRHVAWIFVPVAVWLGAGLARWRRNRMVLPAAVILVGISSLALWNRVTDDRYRNEDSAAVAEYLESVEDGGTVHVSAGYMAKAIDYYLDEDWTVLMVGDVTEDGGGLPAAIEGIRPSGPTWLAYTREFHSDPGGHLIDAVKDSGARHESSFAGIELYSLPSDG